MRDRGTSHDRVAPRVAPRRAREKPPSQRQDSDSPETLARAAGPTTLGFDFTRIPIWPSRGGEAISCSRVAESGIDEAPVPDEEQRLAQTPGTDAGVPTPDAGSPAPKLNASLSIAGNSSYTDTATSSTKPVTFKATFKGGVKEDYIIVNWIKGYLKNAKGKPYKVTMFGSSVDYDFANWRVDSVDTDPAYWSSGGVRWNYSVDAANAFSATDDPGPMYDSDGKGAAAKVDFKTAVYRSGDVGTNVKGPTITATPLSSFQTWNYHVEVLGGGKFNHKL